MTTDFKNHHDRSLAHWNMVDGNGNVLSQGASYGMYETDGRLIQMTGFFDSPDAGLKPLTPTTEYTEDILTDAEQLRLWANEAMCVAGKPSPTRRSGGAY